MSGKISWNEWNNNLEKAADSNLRLIKARADYINLKNGITTAATNLLAPVTKATDIASKANVEAITKASETNVKVIKDTSEEAALQRWKLHQTTFRRLEDLLNIQQQYIKQLIKDNTKEGHQKHNELLLEMEEMIRKQQNTVDTIIGIEKVTVENLEVFNNLIKAQSKILLEIKDKQIIPQDRAADLDTIMKAESDLLEPVISDEPHPADVARGYHQADVAIASTRLFVTIEFITSSRYCCN